LITDLSFVFDGQILFDDVFPTLQKQTQVMRVGSELKLQVGILPILLKKNIESTLLSFTIYFKASKQIAA
jgi:hypothetical protein